MIREIVWTEDAELALLQLPPSDAERLMSALERFAETGDGFVRRMLDKAMESRLYVPGSFAHLEVTDDRIRVIRVVARP